MIVDPYTGQPLELSNPWFSGTSAGSSISNDVLGAYGYTPASQPWLFDVMSHMPSAKATMGWNMFRGSRTIRHGGWREGRGVGAIRSNNPLDPRTWTRLADTSAVYSRGGHGKAYTPFNFLGSEFTNRPTNYLVNKFGSRMTAEGSHARAMGIIDDSFVQGGRNEGYFFSGGALSRISASATLDRLGERAAGRGASLFGMNVPVTEGRQARAARRLASQGKSALNFVKGADSTLHEALIAKYGAEVSGQPLSDAVLASSGGRVTQFATGYMRGARGAVKGMEAIDAPLLEGAGKQAFVKGAEMGAAHIAEEQGAKFMLARGAAALAPVAEFAGPVGLALDTYAVIKMAGSALKGTATLAKDAMVSLRGSINKPVMGMGYVDNTVAATSRARGVQAIANSRLNARSILGSEAAPLAAHFG